VRGPKPPGAISAGQAAAVAAPHAPQVRVCRRYSVPSGMMRGSSATWWRPGAGSSPAKGAPHWAHTSGLTSTMRSTCSTGSSGRPCPAWPTCPPAGRPEWARLRRAGALGGSEDGGRDDVREVCFSRSSSAARRASSVVSRASCSSRRRCWSCTSVRTAAGVAAQSSAEMSGGRAGSGMSPV